MHLNKLEFWSLWAFLNILVIFHIFSLSLETDISKCCVLRSLDSHYNHTLLQLTSKRKILGNLDNFTHPFLNFTDLVLTVLTCPLLFCWIQKLTLLLRKESSCLNYYCYDYLSAWLLAELLAELILSNFFWQQLMVPDMTPTLLRLNK